MKSNPSDQTLSELSPLARASALVGSGALIALYVVFAFTYLKSSDGLLDASGHLIGLDFMVFWSVGVLTEQGHLLDLFDAASLHALQENLFGQELPVKPRIWTHPPPMLFIALPFAQLPYLWALIAWSVLFLGSYLMATRKLALLAAPATFMNLYIGQTGFLIGTFYFGALRTLRARPVLAGVLFGLVAVKPHLGLLIPVALLSLRAWRTMASATLTVAMMVVLSGIVFGWEPWRLWLVEVFPHQTSVLNLGAGRNINFSAWQGAYNLGLPRWGMWATQGLAALIAIIATWWAFSRLRRGLIAEWRAFSILLLGTSMATPYIFNYDWTLLGPVALVAMAELARGQWTTTSLSFARIGELVIWLLVWLLPVLWPLLPAYFAPVVVGIVLPVALGCMVQYANVESRCPQDSNSNCSDT